MMIVNNVLIREATADDARGMLVHVRELLSEPDSNLVTEVDEFHYTDETERQFIQSLCDDDNGLLLLAENITHNEIVGDLMLRPGTRRAERHVVRLGIGVNKGWRGQGIGTHMMEQAVRWARQNREVRRIELEVFTRNTGAINLYTRLGFRIEGTRMGAIKKGKSYLDVYMMALLV